MYDYRSLPVSVMLKAVAQEFEVQSASYLLCGMPNNYLKSRNHLFIILIATELPMPLAFHMVMRFARRT